MATLKPTALGFTVRKMTLLLFCMSLSCLPLYSSASRNDRPIIGVLAQEVYSPKPDQTVYIAASYVKFLESAGARVVPVMINQTLEEYKALFNSINGILYPGGGASIISSGYERTAKIFYELAIEANKKGDYFPVWGTCLGFEQLTYLTSGNTVLSHTNTSGVPLPLNFTDETKDSRLFKGFPAELRANAEYMSPSGKIPFIHVGNQVVSELGPIVQFTKAKGHSLSDGLDDIQRAEMKAYMELVNNMLLTAELYIQWCDDATAAEISRPRYSSPYSWPLSNILAYQKQWEVRRKMNAIGWGGKTLEQVYEDVSQCCQALSQRLGTQPFFFNKQPTELDALVFGHLFTILTTRLTSTELAERIKSYSNLLSFCRRIEQTYFEDKTS